MLQRVYELIHTDQRSSIMPKCFLITYFPLPLEVQLKDILNIGTLQKPKRIKPAKTPQKVLLMLHSGESIDKLYESPTVDGSEIRRSPCWGW